MERRIRDGDAADRPRFAGEFLGGVDAKGCGFAGCAEHPGVIYFSEIVVFRGYPEHGHRWDAAGGELAGYLGGGHGLVDRVGRAGEQSCLLAGDYGYGSGLGQTPKGLAVPVLGFEGGHHGGAAIIWILDLGGGALERFGVVGIVLVEMGNAVEMVGEIGEELGGPRQVSVSDTGGLHETS